jgi:hypothetical protein
METPTLLEYDPGGHNRQLVILEVFEKLPAEQLAQVVEPDIKYCPNAQLTQYDIP